MQRPALKAGRAFLRCRQGVAAIEFALAAPVLVVMAAGVYEFGSALAAQGAVNKLSSQYAGAWADCTDSTTNPCSNELNNYLPTSNATYVLTNIAPQLNSASSANGLDIRMIWVKMSGTTGNLTANFVYGREIKLPNTSVSVTSSNSPTSSEQTLAQKTFTISGQQGVIVTITYTYNVTTLPNFLHIAGNMITMTNTVAQVTNN